MLAQDPKLAGRVRDRDDDRIGPGLWRGHDLCSRSRSPPIVRNVVHDIGYTRLGDGLRRFDLRRDRGPGQAEPGYLPGRQ